nr:hypothetical protein BgiMline_022619 [Biomphalaria glabrata]
MGRNVRTGHENWPMFRTTSRHTSPSMGSSSALDDWRGHSGFHSQLICLSEAPRAAQSVQQCCQSAAHCW